MDKFQQNEQHGRNLFKSILDQCNITDYKFTKYQYAPVDCYAKFGNNLAEIEIKVRSKLYNTLFIELTKYKSMKQILHKHKIKYALYVNFVDNRCYIFNLRNITRKNGCYITNILANKYTAIDSNKVNKQMIEIPVNLATVLEYKDNKWTKLKIHTL